MDHQETNLTETICERCDGTGIVEMEMLSREPWPCDCEAGRRVREAEARTGRLVPVECASRDRVKGS